MIGERRKACWGEMRHRERVNIADRAAVDRHFFAGRFHTGVEGTASESSKERKLVCKNSLARFVRASCGQLEFKVKSPRAFHWSRGRRGGYS